ncbi:MAG TPA: tRNA (adenosine(37)-N6)-threonylcarbamoyltransferase complex ATPase subunit type 1 TsaE [Acholeplasmataceae bacterium]|jgi:tRNA threonylcarbamoyladenosine biosynthesis protein TsaE|nr:tRNA (adenosine(37)-N6)-threonylcarbamoyltransferase complex ATPase subunit type 1 TsaE [Acholeplasmataceae bacterium]
MVKEIEINSESEMIALGKRIGCLLERNMVIALTGDLGAGKTTLTKGIGQALEVKTTINSPTFTILKIHSGTMPLYHMDVYRINPESGDDYLEEYFEKDGVAVVEWAENIAYLLPDSLLKIDIKNLGGTKRLVVLSATDPKYGKIIESVIK